MRWKSKPSSIGGLSLSCAPHESKMTETCRNRKKKFKRRHALQRKATDQWLKIWSGKVSLTWCKAFSVWQSTANTSRHVNLHDPTDKTTASCFPALSSLFDLSFLLSRVNVADYQWFFDACSQLNFLASWRFNCAFLCVGTYQPDL